MTPRRVFLTLTCTLVGIGCKHDSSPKPMSQGPQPLAPGGACDPAAQARHDAATAGTGTGTGGASTTGDTGGEVKYCANGLACEPVAGSDGSYVCARKVEIEGQVIDSVTGDPLEGALVAALDETGAPVTDVVDTDSCGHYALPVSVHRDSKGNIAEKIQWTLFVTAADHLPFPEGARPALPLDVQDVMLDPAGGMDTDGGTTGGGGTGDQPHYVVDVLENAATTIALIPLRMQDLGGVTISGNVEGDQAPGTLVVAEGGKGRAPYGIADASGNYTLFNVAGDSTSIVGYRRGQEVNPATITVGAADQTGVDLTLVSGNVADLAVVTGSLNIVNATGGSMTSVVLVPSSLYNATLERGPVPLGLRAPPPPAKPNVTSGFSIDGVPSGTYKVLVAFENDDLVRDPDTSIAGTAIQEVSPGRGEHVTVPDTFKVTEALAIVGPGKDKPESVDAMPTFEWADDSSEDHYELRVFDALGNDVWDNLMIPGVSGPPTVTLAYGGPALTPGMYYQFRVTSFRDTPQGSSAISRTEDLRGVFFHGEAAPPMACTPGGTGSSTGG